MYFKGSLTNIEENRLIQSYLDFFNTSLSFSEYKNIITVPNHCRELVPTEVDLGSYAAKLLSPQEIEETFNTFNPEFIKKIKQIIESYSVSFSCVPNEDVSNWLGENILCVFSLVKKSEKRNLGMIGFIRYRFSYNRLGNIWCGEFGVDPLLAGRILQSFILFNPTVFAASSIGHRRYKKLNNIPYQTVVKQTEVSEKVWNLVNKLGPKKIYEDDVFDTDRSEYTEKSDRMLVNLYTIGNLKNNFSSFDEVKAESNLL